MLARFPLTLSLIALTSAAAHAISLGSIDDFSSTNEGWSVGSAGVAPTQVNDPSFDGQPGFLRHFSDGSGSNGRWIALSQDSDWTGDYLAAGVDTISLWADGRTGSDIPFWLAFNGPGGWFISEAQTIVTADDWRRFDFDISEAGLTHVAASGGTGVYADTLSGVTRFEMLAGNGPVGFASRGDLLRASQSQNVIWIDNITAVPEPATAASLMGLLAIAAASRRKRS